MLMLASLQHDLL